ncbi:MAG: hypothetical protein GXY83_36005 [Rhodopirellula sp.]|nr:hypothetical protein [Rhodopirellula sp.]
MAVFTSIQTGSWQSATTWDQGAVPNLSVDDVVIAATHEVTFASGQSATLGSGRLISVLAGGTLRIQGTLSAYNSEVLVLGSLIVEGNYLYIYGAAELTIDPGATLTVTTNFYLASSGTVIIQGQMTLESGSLTDLFSSGFLTLEVGGTVQIYGTCYVEFSSQATIRDDFSIENGGYLSIYDNGTVFTIEDSGASFAYGTFFMSFGSLCEVFGYLGIASTGLLYVMSGALMNVYKDIRVGGKMTGGGKIVMFRREGRILDFNDNPVFVLDRAYGFSKALVA